MLELIRANYGNEFWRNLKRTDLLKSMNSLQFVFSFFRVLSYSNQLSRSFPEFSSCFFPKSLQVPPIPSTIIHHLQVKLHNQVKCNWLLNLRITVGKLPIFGNENQGDIFLVIVCPSPSFHILFLYKQWILSCNNRLVMVHHLDWLWFLSTRKYFSGTSFATTEKTNGFRFFLTMTINILGT